MASTPRHHPSICSCVPSVAPLSRYAVPGWRPPRCCSSYSPRCSPPHSSSQASACCPRDPTPARPPSSACRAQACSHLLRDSSSSSRCSLSLGALLVARSAPSPPRPRAPSCASCTWARYGTHHPCPTPSSRRSRSFPLPGPSRQIGRLRSSGCCPSCFSSPRSLRLRPSRCLPPLLALPTPCGVSSSNATVIGELHANVTITSTGRACQWRSRKPAGPSDRPRAPHEPLA
mmetsp:Transcript_14891/g.29944  ORF Transcript_14891/g.29944 Transcript_14891/m.29944 type:complete len:231 (-) Transcript_14891:159-851(-)